jgi:hypothetical protein
MPALLLKAILARTVSHSRSKRACLLLVAALSVVAADAGTSQLPSILPVSEDFYPPSVWRRNEEGRVLVEFRLNERRKPVDWKALMSDEFVSSASGEPILRHSDLVAETPISEISEAAVKVVARGGIRFDPSDPTEPAPQYVYRITVIFCLQPGHCDFFVPFPNTTPIIIRKQRWVRPPERVY